MGKLGNMENIHVTIHLKTDTLLTPAKAAIVPTWADIDRLKDGLIGAVITGQITNEFLTDATITACNASQFDVRKFRFDGIEWVKVY